MSAAPRLSLVVPLVHVRGDAVDHLRTWTDGQTLARDRYQVVVAADGSAPDVEARVASLLKAHDAFVREPGLGDMGLYTAGARRADCEWLVFSEAHCLADPGCLAAVEKGLVAEPDLDAAGLVAGGHVRPTPLADMLADWFETVFAEWGRSEWRRLSFFGMAIRRSLFLELGAVSDRYGLFSPMLLSALLHERGARVGRFPDAQVVHIADERIAEHHEHTAAFARGECLARADHPFALCERYFGHEPVWPNRLRYRPPLARVATRALVAAALRAVLRRRREIPWLARELTGWAPAALAGPRPRALAERARLALDELVAERSPLPRGRRWRWFVSGHARAARIARLAAVAEEAAPPGPPLERSGRTDGAELDGDALVGAHALERDGEAAFRWTRPSAVLRIAPSAKPRRLVLHTGGLRGPPLRYVEGVWMGRRRVPRRALSGDTRRLHVPLPATDGEGDGDGLPITLLCRPLNPAELGTQDPRRLGMPLFSVELRTET